VRGWKGDEDHGWRRRRAAASARAGWAGLDKGGRSGLAGEVACCQCSSAAWPMIGTTRGPVDRLALRTRSAQRGSVASVHCTPSHQRWHGMPFGSGYQPGGTLSAGAMTCCGALVVAWAMPDTPRALPLICSRVIRTIERTSKHPKTTNGDAKIHRRASRSTATSLATTPATIKPKPMTRSPVAARPSSDTLRAKATAVQSLPVTVSLLCRKPAAGCAQGGTTWPGTRAVRTSRGSLPPRAPTAHSGRARLCGGSAGVGGGCPQVEFAGLPSGKGGLLDRRGKR
jgi:hypothetical protein